MKKSLILKSCAFVLAVAVCPECKADNETRSRCHGADEHNCGKDERT